MTPQFSEVIWRITTEINLQPHGDVLLNIPHNGPKGFGSIVKSCFFTKNPEAIKHCLSEIQNPVLPHGPRGPEMVSLEGGREGGPEK